MIKEVNMFNNAQVSLAIFWGCKFQTSNTKTGIQGFNLSCITFVICGFPLFFGVSEKPKPRIPCQPSVHCNIEHGETSVHNGDIICIRDFGKLNLILGTLIELLQKVLLMLKVVKSDRKKIISLLIISLL